MLAEVRRVLDVIEDVLIKGDIASSDLANILSALRGPDALNSHDLKMNTTVHIRSLVFPRLANRTDNTGYWFLTDKARLPSLADLTDCESRHFHDHILYAVDAIERPSPETGVVMIGLPIDEA